MIRQICPHCFAPVEVADGAAGTTVPCPKCGKSFPVPAAYAPTVDAAAGPPKESLLVTPDRPIPPPGFIAPPPPAPPTPAGPPPAASPAPAGSEHSAGFALAPKILDWVPAGCLGLIVVLSFFTWVGMYPGGYKAYYQNGWDVFFGWLDSAPFAEEVLKQEAALNKQVGFTWLLLPYFFGLFVTTGLAVLDRLFRHPDITSLPGPLAWLPQLWPHRFAVLTGLTMILLLLIFAQARLGFGLENAAKATASEMFKAEREAADNSAARQKVYVKEGAELGKYQVQTTTWFNLLLAAHVTAAGAMVLRFWLHRRGDKSLPRVAVYW